MESMRFGTTSHQIVINSKWKEDVIYSFTSEEDDYETQKLYLNLVQKIVKLNEKGLSPENKEREFTLESAHAIGCKIYICARNHPEDKRFMESAIKALTCVAEAYAKKNQFHLAVDSLIRLDYCDGQEPLQTMFERWKNYIQSNAQDKSEYEELRYDGRLQSWRNDSQSKGNDLYVNACFQYGTYFTHR